MPPFGRRALWTPRLGNTSPTPISAKLVAALAPKPIPVTGWALANGVDREQGGAKSTHLAVPAGAVYYFEADTPEAAAQLATALNWHGATDGTEIKTRCGRRAKAASCSSEQRRLLAFREERLRSQPARGH